ncbi:hypothetical protein AAHA92_29159 [Salvia divinorum]|uniref:Secreted protein n=1 Tax=Salvia divinorum TaxID=28513 RepID=A0ABD1FXF7_SALDI
MPERPAARCLLLLSSLSASLLNSRQHRNRQAKTRSICSSHHLSLTAPQPPLELCPPPPRQCLTIDYSLVFFLVWCDKVKDFLPIEVPGTQHIAIEQGAEA